jgi:hypothetical protein
MEQNIQHQIKILTESARRYWLLLEGTRQDLERQPNNSVLQMRIIVLEQNIDNVLHNIEGMLRSCFMN